MTETLARVGLGVNRIGMKSMMNGEAGGRLPHFTPACKYFEVAEKERPISKS